jgi:hypothetical protein
MAENDGRVPIPDPTKLTTEAVALAVAQSRLELDQVRTLLEQHLAYVERLLDERYATQTKALDAAFVAAEKAVATALASAEKAVSTAQAATDKRFDAVAEFQKLLTGQVGAAMPRLEYNTAHKALEDKLADTRDRVQAIESLTRGIGQATDDSRANIGQRLLILGVALTAVVIIINVTIALVIHH